MVGEGPWGAGSGESLAALPRRLSVRPSRRKELSCQQLALRWSETAVCSVMHRDTANSLMLGISIRICKFILAVELS